MIFLLVACAGSTESTTVDKDDTEATSFEFPCDDSSRQVHVDISDRDPATRSFVEGVVVEFGELVERSPRRWQKRTHVSVL